MRDYVTRLKLTVTPYVTCWRHGAILEARARQHPGIEYEIAVLRSRPRICRLQTPTDFKSPTQHDRSRSPAHVAPWPSSIQPIHQKRATMARVPPQLPPRKSTLPPRGRSSSPSATSQASHSSVSPARPRAGTVHLTPFSRSRSQSPGAEMHAPDEAPPPYSEQWGSADPRSSSMHSLLPAESINESRRKLLLIYIHGFMGNETSFKSFPAHIHNILTLALAESHVVHTKIYPRYKSRRAIDYARDDFSNWYEDASDYLDLAY